MQGFFELANASDLLKKLNHDFEQLKKNPDNTYVAFNFFVTAEHMLDWLYPKSTNKLKRTQERKKEVLIQICSHVANGAKHFEVEASHHRTVSNLEKVGGYFPSSYFPSSYFPRRYFSKGGLVVQLEGNAKHIFGDSISVLSLAHKILDFWNSHPDLS